MTGVVLADDHAIARSCIAARIVSEPSLSLLAEAEDGPAAVAAVDRHRPDVLAAAVGLPGLSGFDLARRLSAQSAPTRVVLFAGPSREAYALEALRAGASGYVVRSASGAELMKAVREAAGGRRYLSPALRLRVPDGLAKAADPYQSLTGREREVLRLAVDGLTSARIGERLCISRRTAESHRASVLGKLGLGNQTELILFAVRRGIVPID
jgi:DNA-binding NarL/FixJ family response regulator